MRINCPKCGLSDRLHSKNSSFEQRGRLEMRSVVKCKGCKSGLFLGVFSGIFFGNPKVISEQQWFDLDSRWNRHFSPTCLAEEDMVELGLSFHSLFGFAHGYSRLKQVTDPARDGSPEQSFYLNSLRTLCVNYFIGTSKRSSDMNIRKILEKHNLPHLLKPIDGILNTKLESTTFGEILKRFRNKFLTHELFQVSPLDDIYKEFDMRRKDNWIVYHLLEQDLFDETVKLFYDLRERYPEAWLSEADLRS